MRIVIAGATKLGATLAARLVDAKADVVLIDKDEAALDMLADTLDCGMIHGDATLPSVLREAAGDSADVLVALTHSDEDNILCAVVGRSVGFNRVLPQIAEIELGAICNELELKDYITPDENIATSLISAIEDGSSPMRASPLSEDTALADYEAQGELVGRSASDLECGEDARLVSIVREGEGVFPDQAGRIEAGDRLVLLTRRAAIRGVIGELCELDGSPQNDE